MEKNTSLQNLIQWFDEYVEGYYTGVEEFDYNISLKHLHTHRVLKRAAQLAEHLGIETELRCRAETAALLHDCGRFEQYRRYKSFRDDITVDHGHLGAQVVRDLNLLKGYGPEDRRDILFAVESHNKKELPETPTRTALEITKIVRDADRTDIFRVIADQLDNKDDPHVNTAFWGLEDRNEISDPVYEAVLSGRPVDRGDMRTRIDFLCMVLSWVYLMNYPQSLELAAETGQVSRLTAHLPDTERGRKIRAEIGSFG
ncbi:MAG: HD domain-containing protein [Spirochaetia bacterium]